MGSAQSKQDKGMKPAPEPSKEDKVMEPTPGPSRQGISNTEMLDSNMNELQESFDNKVMEPASEPNGLCFIEGWFALDTTELRDTSNKVMKLTPGPSGQGSSDVERFDSKTSELRATSYNEIIGSGQSKLGCITRERSELRETYVNKIVEPASVQNISITGVEIQGSFSLVALNNIKTGGDIIIKMPENASDIQLSAPLIYGFPTRLEDEVCVGREEDIAELLKLLESNQYVLVTGCGGIGKTTLAMKCAEKWTKAGKFQKAAFLLMETMGTTTSSFYGLATKYNLKSEKSSILQELRSLFEKINKNQQQTLLIFDNIDDKMAIQRYLPSKNEHSYIYILGTSQQDIPKLFHSYKLGELPEWAAMELVKKIYNIYTEKNLQKDIPEGLLKELVLSVDCLALAVRQAASAICQDVEETKKDIVNAIETYIKECHAKLDDQLGQEYLNYYEKTVYAALHYNVCRCVNDDVIAKKLLHVSSHLNPICITDHLLKHVPGVTEEVLSKLIYRFVRYSLVTEVDEYLTMHRMTQAVVRHAYADAEGDVLPCVLHIMHTSDHWTRHFHLNYFLPEMSESMLTGCYRRLFTSDSYKREKVKLEEYEEGLVLEWEAPQFAAYFGHKEVLDRLRQLSSPDTWVTKSGRTWIHAAALGGQTYALNEYMTDSSINDKQIAKTGHTDLHLAARAIDACSLNIRDVCRDSELYVAFSRGHLDTAQKLLKAGSDINPELCSETTATYTVTRELEFPSSTTGREHVLEVDIQYFYITTIVQVEEMIPGLVFKFCKLVESPRNSQMLKEIQDKSSEKFVAVLEVVDRIWEFAVLASRYIHQHGVTVHQLVKEISGEKKIHGFNVLYPPQAALCSRALAFTKMLLNKIKDTSSDTFNVLVALASLPYGFTVNYASRYLKLSTQKINAVTKMLKSYGILYKEGLIEDMWGLTRAFITMEKLPSDICVSLFTTALCTPDRFDENLACLILAQMSLKQLTAACEQARRLDPQSRWMEVLEKLQKVECKSIETVTDVTWSALHNIVVFFDIDCTNFPERVIDRLLKLGIEVNVRGPGDVTPLHIAASSDMSSETVRLLVKNGAQVNAVTLEHLTPLHMAASNDSLNADKTVAVLLGAGGEVNAVTLERLTPLHMAASSTCLFIYRTICVLLKAGAQVNAVTHKGFTPLHMAASNTDYYAYKPDQIIRELLEAGANPQIQDKKGRTPLDVAHPWSRDILKSLLKT